MKGSAAILSLIIVFFACNSDKFQGVPQNEKPFFESADTLLFKSSSGVIDSIKVEVFDQVEVRDKTVHYETVRIPYHRIKQGAVENSVLMYVTQDNAGASITAKQYTFQLQKKIDRVTLSNGELLDQVSVFTWPVLSGSRPEVAEIWFKPYYGVIRYRYFDGNWLDLQMP